MPSADPMRATEQTGSQDAPPVAAAAGGASASLDTLMFDLIRQGHCPNCGAHELERCKGALTVRCGLCGDRFSLEMSEAAWK